MALVKIALDARNSMGQALADHFDLGSGPARIRFYTGTQPAGPGSAVTSQTLLGTLLCSDPASEVIGGVVVFDTIAQDDMADANGTATWARIETSAGVAKVDLDVSDLAGDGAIKLNSVDILQGGPITLASLSLTMPGG